MRLPAVRPLALRGLYAVALIAATWSSGSWGCSDCDLRISTRMLPPATIGIRYSVPLTSNCGGDAWFLQTGSLPPGIGLEEDGDLAGIPTLQGTYPFTVGVFDFATGETAYKGFSIVVGTTPPTPTATPG